MPKKESSKRWRENNKDKVIELQRKWQRDNKEYCNEKAKKFYRENKDAINDRKRKNPKTLYSTIKRNAHMRGMEITISQEKFIEWWNKQEQICVYCSIPVSRLAYTDISRKLSHRLSIDRMDNNLGYCEGNLALSCLRCNFIKSNLFTFDEMKEIGDKYIKPKWQS